MRPRFAPLLASLLVTTAALPAFALGSSTPAPASSKIEPGVIRAIRTGLVGAFQRSTPVPGSAPVIVELTAPATPASLTDLRAAGAELTIVDGQIIFYDRFVPARVDAAAAAALAALPGVSRVGLRPGRGPLPLDHSAQLMRIEDARGARPAMERLTGAGVVVGDVDSAVDIYHPVFFRGDAGYFDWIDVDGDGVFTPGVDAIDLDHSGKADPGETGQVLRAETYVDYLGGAVQARTPGFDPAVDWIFLDTNGNGARDYGKAGGFDDTAPAFGEPIFVPDDVNQNGKLDVGERVVRLGSSKFRKVYVDLNWASLGITKQKHIYQRGVDLSSIPIDYSKGQLYGFPDALHATGVLGIVAGDVPLVGRRWVGIAPDVEIIEGFEVDQNESLPIGATTWALKEKPDVMLYEMAVWTGVPLDGSDLLSQMIDTSNQNDGVAHTCPTGDQAAARKHTHADLAAGAMTSLPFAVPAKAQAGTGPISYVDLTLHVQGGTPASMTLTGPGVDSIDLVANANQMGMLAGGAGWYVTTETTPRGTYMVDVILYAMDQTTAIPTGTWTLTLGGAASAALTCDAYVSDDKSSWAVGVAWDKSISTDASTIGIPSTADHCIAVGAHPNHVDDNTKPWFDMYYAPYDVPAGYHDGQGQVRAYSPRGPRIDGVMKPDVLAPDNPWTAQETGTDKSGPPYGSYQVFGGTSGASPHVTGATALLVQAGLRGDAARDALRMGAVSDATTGKTPNGDYGYGRIDVAASLGVKTNGATPTISLAVSPDKPTTKDKVIITPTVASGDASTDGLQIEWDDDYDGTWDVAYAAPGPRTITSDTPVTRPFKVRVRNGAGHIAEAVTWVTFAKAPAAPADSGGCGCRTTGGGSPLAALAVVALALAAARRRRR